MRPPKPVNRIFNQRTAETPWIARDLRSIMDVQSLPTLTSPERVAAIFGDLCELSDDCLMTATVDDQRRLIRVDVIRRSMEGDLRTNVESILAGVILSKGHGFYLIRGHRTEKPAPSQMDFDLADKFRTVAKLLGYRFLDYVHIGRKEYCYLNPEAMELTTKALKQN